MRSHLVVIILCFVSLNLIAQDSLVSIDDLKFTSLAEEELFKKLNATPDQKLMFDLMMVCGDVVEKPALDLAWNSFQGQVGKLQEIALKEKRNDKRIKSIYDYVHKTFLRKYEEENQFKQIFTIGNYNCVSASGLYALYFEQLHIPYEIKEVPSHVFLMAYPGQNQIKVESTSPLNGIVTMNEDFKKGFVKMLRDNKMISQQEFASQSTDALFARFYFSENKSISLQELAAIQYANSAIYLYEANKYEPAFQQIKKAHYLFNTERTRYLLSTTGASAFHEHKERDEDQARMLGVLARLAPGIIDYDVIKGEFSNVIQELLFVNNKREKLELYYSTLMKNIHDEKFRNELDYIYQFENGRYYYNLGRNKEVRTYWEKALALQPENTDMLSAFTSLIARSFGTAGDYPALIAEAEHYSSMYPRLRENNNFNTLLASAYGIQFGMFYNMNKPAEGDKHRLMFEAMLTKYPDIEIQSSIVGQSYGLAAVYYYRKGQTVKARAIIEKGLTISPNNQELLIRKEMIK